MGLQEDIFMQWIAENAGNIIILALVAACAAAAVYYIVKRHREGRDLCSGGCGNCPMHGQCRKPAARRQQPDDKRRDREE